MNCGGTRGRPDGRRSPRPHPRCHRTRSRSLSPPGWTRRRRPLEQSRPLFRTAAEAMRPRILVDSPRGRAEHGNTAATERKSTSSRFTAHRSGPPPRPGGGPTRSHPIGGRGSASGQACQTPSLHRIFHPWKRPWVLGISPRTADRVWSFARASLHPELAKSAANTGIVVPALRDGFDCAAKARDIFIIDSFLPSRSVGST